MGETLSDNYSDNFANGFNEIILKGIITKQTKTFLIFTITEIVNLNIKHYDYTELFVPGDKLKIEWVSKYELSDKKIYYNLNDISNTKIDLSTDIAILCSKEMYTEMLHKDKYSELTEILDKFEFENPGEKDYLINLLNDYIKQIQDSSFK